MNNKSVMFQVQRQTYGKPIPKPELMEIPDARFAQYDVTMPQQVNINFPIRSTHIYADFRKV